MIITKEAREARAQNDLRTQEVRESRDSLPELTTACVNVLPTFKNVSFTPGLLGLSLGLEVFKKHLKMQKQSLNSKIENRISNHLLCMHTQKLVNAFFKFQSFMEVANAFLKSKRYR